MRIITSLAHLLNPPTNAVVAGNTVYMQQVHGPAADRGLPVQDEDLAQLFCARFEHVNRLGNHTFY